MPSWSIHDKYAKKFGIPLHVSRFINKFIDKHGKIWLW